ncbi:unnamed protein product [Enterobius vermicularis]|uniref:RING-type domain-containing protein n=1 Tax=Enterobius vermicularis TaxID=51028 RepID=A0A0N4VL58_ENTVE|nr:unnamed protein product [Enterobius vermicularis]
MNKLSFNGALGAVNALAVSDDGKRAYVFDPRVDAVIRINLANGQRDTLRWFDRSFRHPRWLCYCMFTMHRDSATYLPTLFYNKKRRSFLLVTFVIDDQKLVLYKTQENVIDVEPIRFDRLAYSAHKDESRLHVSIQMSNVKHKLPQGQWELPFIAHQSLHFISMEFATTQLASISTEGNMDHNDWKIKQIAADLNDALPARKATWINAWRAGMGWYVVCEKQIRDFETTRWLSLWQLDVLDCKWRKLPATTEIPMDAKNFALRIDMKNTAFLHCDWERDAAIFRMRLDELMLQREDEAVAASEQIPQDEDLLEADDNNDSSNYIELSNSQIICPICLDTYDDPRTLSCGHSICNNCIEHMKAAVQSNTIRCFACRKITTIPSTGLPVNFGLKDAIEALDKVRQLSGTNLRCAHCRKLCNEEDLWVCGDCALADSALVAYFLTEEIPESVTDGHKKVLFCAQCILKHHTSHDADQLSSFREKFNLVRERDSACKKRVNEVFEKFEATLEEKLKAGLLEPLMKDIQQELRGAFNTTAYSKRVLDKSAADMVSDFERRLLRIVANIDSQFERDSIVGEKRRYNISFGTV